METASGPLASVNDWLNQNVVPAGVLTGAILAASGVLWAAFRGRRRVGWRVLYDQRLNQGGTDLWHVVPERPINPAQPADPGGDGDDDGTGAGLERALTRLGRDLALLSPGTAGTGSATGAATGAATAGGARRPDPREQNALADLGLARRATGELVVADASLVILEVKNTGFVPIGKDNWGKGLQFAFGGRKVVDYKIREADDGGIRDDVDAHRRAAGADESAAGLDLPPLDLNHREAFQIIVLLGGPVADSARPVRRSGGKLKGGSFPQLTSRRRRLAVVAAVLLTAAAATGTGVWVANSALTPDARCASGTLRVAGSTAFAPIATIAKNAYEEQCRNAHITIAPIGSSEGVTELAGAADPADEIAMVDGTPAQNPGGALERHSAGVVLFAVVENHSLAGKLSAGQVRDLFAGKADRAGLVLVGRAPGSGTRAAFEGTVLAGPETALDTASTCPAPGTAVTVTACTEPTTMDLLAFVDATPGAVGYAEADALPYFPNVEVVPLDGAAPSRQSALHGGYPFVATENLYTVPNRSELASDFVAFLESDAMAARLHDYGYVGCSEVGGTDLSGQCA